MVRNREKEHNMEKTYVDTGDIVMMEMPYSEVCMSMRVAGHTMFAKVVSGAMGTTAAQLYELNGKPFSFPILMGEAGFLFDGNIRRYYCYGIKCELPVYNTTA
jgi:hypothetical protein